MKEIFWDTLGIAPTTDTKKIRKAYSGLVKQHNPEDDEEAFRKINQAYRAAMNFARQMSALNISDDQIVVTDKREDGSFGVQFVNRDGTPLLPTPPAALPEQTPSAADKADTGDKGEAAPEQMEDKEFDFGSIDSSVVKAYSFAEASERAGMISFAIGFAVPDSERTRAVKKFLDENNIVSVLGERGAPGEESGARKEGLRVAELIVDSEYVGEKVLWQFYFTSPLIISLRIDLHFYIKLEDLINGKNFPIKTLLAVADGSGLRPLIVNTGAKVNDEPKYAIDLRSRVPFRYEEGKYPALDKLMKKEKPEEYKTLTDFLSKVPVNLYGILMPFFHPNIKDSVGEAAYAFKYITTSQDCKDMRDNRLLWKLYFKGNLVTPIMRIYELHMEITKQTMSCKLPLGTLKIIKKEMAYRVPAYIKRKKEDKEWYYLFFLKPEEYRGSYTGRYLERPVVVGEHGNDLAIRFAIMIAVVLLFFAVMMGSYLMMYD